MSSKYVAIRPDILVWARERAGIERDTLAERFPKLPQWESGMAQPTLRQLEAFADAVHIPFGYLFLPEPVQEQLPVSDFRTIAAHTTHRPSPNLLDTLHLCQQRQDWYKEYARFSAMPQLPFIGSTSTSDSPIAVAQTMREILGLSVEQRQRLPDWQHALRHFIHHVEEAGILVMVSSVVGSNSHRKLRVEEFRGFALADSLAPLIFLNGADSKAAQMFTLAHELAHLWLGVSGVSDTEAGPLPGQASERWCNAVAAELLMPIQAVRTVYNAVALLQDEIERLARYFKVSTLVTLRRLHEAGFIDTATHWEQYRREAARLSALAKRSSGGGNFYHSLGARTGKRFARAILASTLEGQTLFQDAFRMLGVKKNSTFYAAARELGVLI